LRSSPTLLSGIHQRLDAILRPIEVGAAAIGGAMLISAMLLTAADVVLRYIFDLPLDFAYYFTESYLMVGMMTMPMAWGFRAGGYIRVIGIARMLPPVVRFPLLRLGLTAGAVYIAILGWLAWEKFVDAYVNNSVEMGVIDWPVSWSWICIPIGCLVFTLRLLAMAIGPAEELHFDHASAAEDVV
jgi:TRAP-type C4-dicarboxylate transport system permease small subunit